MVPTSPRSGGAMVQWGKLVQLYCTYLVAIGRPPTTVGLRSWQLKHLAEIVQKAPAGVSQDDLLQVFATHTEWKPETRKSYRAAMRGFFDWAQRQGHLNDDPARDLPKFTVPRAAARPCPEQLYRAALARGDDRLALMLRLAAEAGLRRGEIAQVHARDLIDADSGPALLVHGKGGKLRLVPITDSLYEAIAARGGWAFPSQRGEHLTARTIGAMCSQALQPATVHQLRHRFATRAYRGSHNIRAVQELLGHSSIATTQRYVDCSEDERREAMLAAVGAA